MRGGEIDRGEVWLTVGVALGEGLEGGTPRGATTNEAGPSKGLYVGAGTGVPATPAHNGALGAAANAAGMATPYGAAAYPPSVNVNGTPAYAATAGQVAYPPQTPYGQSAYAAQTPYTGQAAAYTGQVGGAYPAQYSMHYSGLQYGQMPAVGVGYPGQFNPYDKSHRKPFLQHAPPVDRAKIERLSAKDKDKDKDAGSDVGEQCVLV